MIINPDSATPVTTDGELTELFYAVGDELGGWGSISARFARFARMQTRYSGTPSGTFADIEVTDYLKGAPANALAELVRHVLHKIKGELYPVSDTLRDYIATDAFAEKYQMTALGRWRNVGSPVGNHKNLTDSVKRLVAKGLMESDKGLWVGWTKKAIAGRVTGERLSMMNIIAVSCLLDSPDVPDEVVDLAVYKEYACIKKYHEDLNAKEADIVLEAVNSYPDAGKVLAAMDRGRFRLIGD